MWQTDGYTLKQAKCFSFSVSIICLWFKRHICLLPNKPTVCLTIVQCSSFFRCRVFIHEILARNMSLLFTVWKWTSLLDCILTLISIWYFTNWSSTHLYGKWRCSMVWIGHTNKGFLGLRGFHIWMLEWNMSAKEKNP